MSTVWANSTQKFHLTKNDREGLKLVSKMVLKKWNTNFRLEYSVRKNRTTFNFQMFRCSRKCSAGPTQKARSIYFPTRFSGNSFLMVRSLGVKKNGVLWKDNKREHDTAKCTTFASVVDLKRQDQDKWRTSEDRYCKILTSWTVFVHLCMSK